ncbi:hypothetical protein, variant 1 [Aphanomyces astaci]|uniref:EF-hand domain-containing protein n=1 Tax=Aphanomyces astaci TaxID=112090 RepID=W4GZE0_APHAT|nr:hypothetical protein, variant 1 [Aphanomyces astaci]ETV85080.1 hypothetical protein, variant 1 [Aphanomyces astaci]|eukprot:XP_009825098.1 hypothetical protein, variant 1 [Aphanomyces astaci]
MINMDYGNGQETSASMEDLHGLHHEPSKSIGDTSMLPPLSNFILSGISLTKKSINGRPCHRCIRIVQGQPLYIQVEGCSHIRMQPSDITIIASASCQWKAKSHRPYAITITLRFLQLGRHILRLQCARTQLAITNSPLEVHCVADLITALGELSTHRDCVKQQWHKANGHVGLFVSYLLQVTPLGPLVGHSVVLEGLTHTRHLYDLDSLGDVSDRLALQLSNINVNTFEHVQNVEATVQHIHDDLVNHQHLTNSRRLTTSDGPIQWILKHWKVDVQASSTPCPLRDRRPQRASTPAHRLADLVVSTPEHAATCLALQEHSAFVLPVVWTVTDRGDAGYSTVGNGAKRRRSTTRFNDDGGGANGPSFTLRSALLGRMQQTRESMQTLFHCFTDSTAFGVERFITTMGPPQPLVVSFSCEELCCCFDFLDIERTGNVTLGAFQTFCMDPTHRSFWTTFCQELAHTICAKHMENQSQMEAIFGQATQMLVAMPGYAHVQCVNGWCSWESFVHGLQVLVPTISANDLVRVCRRFDVLGNGHVDIRLFCRAVLKAWVASASEVLPLNETQRSKRASSATNTTSQQVAVNGQFKAVTKACLQSHTRPDVRLFNSSLAVRKLFESRAHAATLIFPDNEDENDKAKLHGRANHLLTTTKAKPVSWLVKEGVWFRPKSTQLGRAQSCAELSGRLAINDTFRGELN